MSDNKTLDDLYELFYITTYSCNRRLEDVIRKSLEEYRQSTIFAFHEYFFHQPLCKTQDISKDAYLLAPFAVRMIERSMLVPDVPDGMVNLTKDWQINYEPRKDDYSLNKKIMLLSKSSWFTHAAFERWKNNKFTAEIPNDKERGDKERSVGLVYEEHKGHNAYDRKWFGSFSNFTPKIFEEVANSVHQVDGKPHNITNFSRKLHYGFIKLVYPVEAKDTKFCSLFVPIASSHIFYGTIWIKFAIAYTDEKKKIFSDIGYKIAEAINEIYVPTLALMHNHFCEHLATDEKVKQKFLSKHEITLQVCQKHDDATTYKNVFASHSSKEQHSEPIEEGLFNLWEKRGSEDKSKKLEDSFIFKKYLVCSRKMVELTRKVVEDARNIKADDKTLPSVLVIGGAGSGKDTFSQMPGLFSKSFCAGTRYTVNMASLKPAPLVSGMVTGAEAEMETTKSNFFSQRTSKSGHLIKGILQKIRQETIADIKIKKVSDLKEYSRYPTLILDELNSMDIDSQGVLLRFLENGEMIPLGAIKDVGLNDFELMKKYGDEIKRLNCCLVVGVMNEDPDELSREKATDFIKDGSYLGGLLGDLLYEHFTSIRRLRPDIKYRMSRNGKYKLPMLRERKEDIPLLFHIFCKTELKESAKEQKLHVTLEAFDSLLSDNLLWRGNVRELQTLAKRVVSCTIKDGLWNGYCVITKRHVDQGLKDLDLTT
ncbi:MAG: hypothetical protein HY957_08330 [Nitrospirae bacterium]|nr:hypothetical protein [Nitrospirota bacterium]